MDEIAGFSKTEYLITFHSIIFGFIASLYLSGWGDLVRSRKQLIKLTNYLLFSGLIFSVMLIHWWNLYGRAETMGWSIWSFLSALPYSILFYFIAILTFGTVKDLMKIESKIDLGEVYIRNKNKLFGLLLLFFIYDLSVTLHSDALIFRIVGVAFCIAAILIHSKKAHCVLLFSSMIIVLFYVVLDYLHLISETALKKDYSKVEHLTIFISLIYGYVITVYFEGWSRLFKLKSHAFSPTQFLWSLFSFFFLIDIWWGSWSRNAFIARDILHFIVFLIVPFVIYLIGVLLFPKAEIESYEIHFFNNKKLIFLLFGGLLLIQIILSRLFTEHAGAINYFRILGILMAVIASKNNNLRFHKISVTIAFCLLVMKELIRF